jgi:hypothetical protein
MSPDGIELPALKRAQVLCNDSHRFSAPHVLSLPLPGTSGAGLDFLFCGNAERQVERTRADKGRQEKHNCQNAQNCPGEPGNGVREVQDRDDNRKKEAKKTICVTHVLFHGKTPFIVKRMIDFHPIGCKEVEKDSGKRRGPESKKRKAKRLLLYMLKEGLEGEFRLHSGFRIPDVFVQGNRLLQAIQIRGAVGTRL